MYVVPGWTCTGGRERHLLPARGGLTLEGRLGEPVSSAAHRLPVCVPVFVVAL